MKSSKITARLLSAVLAIMMLFSLVTVGFTASAAQVEIAPTGVTMTGGEKLYLVPNSNWNIDNARFAIYVFGSGSAWASMTKVSGESNLYEVTVPAGSWTNVIFCRMNPANNVNDWGSNGSHKWNQTDDLTYDGTNNCYTVKEGTWDKGGGTWSVYTPPVPAVAPATPAAATVTISGNLGGTGTEADPFLVAPEKAMNMLVSGTIADDATGLAYNVDYTASKVDLDAGAISVLYTGATAPAVDVAKAVNVYLWAYQATATDKAYSAEYATTTIYVKGYEATVDPEDPVVDNSYDLPYENADGLYAYAGTEVSGTNAWQRWHQNNDVRHFFLAPTASDTEVIVLNTYSSDVFLNGVMIPAGEYATVPYVDGTTYTCSGATTQKVYIAKTDAEGAIYVNSQDGMVTVNDDANETETEVDATYDLYAFLTGGTKNREATGVAGAVASEDGINEAATIKKIKGRGNSTWGETKKPFNITYKDNVQVDGMKGKKWSLLANAKDGSLLRNRLVYDMANEISMVYACDSRFVDFFVNGYYKGSYQLTQKIEMGNNTVMPDLEEPEVEDVTEDDGTVTPYPKADFDFILELDTEENAANAKDKGYTTPEGQWMTYKTPDDPAAEQIEFIKSKYNELEEALYGDDMAALEQILDLNDFARAYLINEVSKNIDAGVTSCYFVYSSAAGKFYASPVWDYDNSIGNLPDNGARTDMNGKVLDLDGPSGWYTRDLKHYARNARNVFGQAWYNTSKTADGKSFQDIVLEVWNADFADIVDILNGDATANGRLKSYEAYMQNLTKTGTWNQKADGAYVTADWKANKTSLAVYNYNAETNTYTTENKEYPATFEGETEYAADWTISRLNWMAIQYAEASVDVPDGYITIYFENNWSWPDPTIHMWGSKLQSDTTWPGKALTNVVGQNDAGYDIYEIVIPEDLTGIIFNGTGEYGTDQTDDITSGWYEGICYYMVYDEATDTKTAGTYDYKVPEEEETTTPAESEPASEDETETTAPEEETTTPVVDAETVTIYVENNWKWADGSIYFWGSATAENPAYPGIAYTDLECVGQNTDGIDIYKVELPADATGFLLVGTGSYGEDKSADVLEWAEGDCFYMVYDETLAAKVANSHPYSDHVTVDPTTPDEEE
ncbi:MAG: CotH kinase family protein, partial [Ruminococcus sp.]|nr:CotH kinase family protein [Ruminococcus sp.]